MEELEKKISHINTRLVNCSQLHQEKDSKWIDGTCITPSLATKEILALIATHEKQLISKFAEIIGEDEALNHRVSPFGNHPVLTIDTNREEARNKFRAEQRTKLANLTKSIERGE